MLKSLIGKRPALGMEEASQSAHRFADTVQSEEVRANALERTVLVDSLSTLRSILESQTELQGLEVCLWSSSYRRFWWKPKPIKDAPLSGGPKTWSVWRIVFWCDAQAEWGGRNSESVGGATQARHSENLAAGWHVFADNNHPARQFINQLGKLGAVKRLTAGWIGFWKSLPPRLWMSIRVIMNCSTMC